MIADQCAEFRVSRVWLLEARLTLVVEGEVLAGPIDRSMNIRLPINRSVGFCIRIDDVEFIDRSDPRRGEVALVRRCADRIEADFLVGLLKSAEGEVLTVSTGPCDDRDDQ